MIIHANGRTCKIGLPLMIVSTLLSVRIITAGVAEKEKIHHSVHNVNFSLESFSLPNGLRAVISRDASAPIVSICMSYLVGSANEQRGKTGLAHLVEHLTFRNATLAGDMQHRGSISGVSGNANAMTSVDRTAYYQTVPMHNLENALRAEAERMAMFSITASDLKIERSVVLEEKNMKIDVNPVISSRNIAVEKIYNCFEYAHPTSGLESDLNGIDIRDVIGFRRKFYGPERAVLTIVGNVSVEHVKKRIHALFGSIKQAGVEKITKSCADVNKPEGLRIQVNQIGLNRTRVDTYFRMPMSETREWYAMLIAGTVLGDGMSSKVYNAIAKEMGISSVVRWSTQHRIGVPISELTIAIAGKADSTNIARIIDTQVEMLCSRPMEYEVLRSTQKRILLEMITDLQSMSNRAKWIGLYALFYNNPRLINIFGSRLYSVTGEEVSQVSRQYLRRAREIVVTKSF